MCGFAEELEYVETCDAAQFDSTVTKKAVVETMLKAAKATADFYIDHTSSDGIPYWDTGAPGLMKLGDYYNAPADPYNEFEPVDSSAAAITAQGLLRLGNYLLKADPENATRYVQAGLTVIRTLLGEPYISTADEHEGLILHSVYHRPNGWDNIPAGRKIPCHESSMWGDYHAREVVLYLQKQIKREPYYTFYGGLKQCRNRNRYTE
jgi:hypothetical protein